MSFGSLVDMTAVQLIAACKSAQRTCSSQHFSHESGINYRPPYDAPDCRSAANSELVRLKPLYVQLLTDESINKEMHSIIEAMHPDGAAAMLYVLELPGLIYQTRIDCSGLSGNLSSEPFPLYDVMRAILKETRLLAWCRNMLGAAQSYCEPVCASALQLLVSASEQDNTDGAPSKHRTSAVLLLLKLPDDNAAAKDTALRNLFDEFGEVLRKPTLHPGAIVNAFQLLTRASRFINTPYGSQCLFAQRSACSHWLSALDKVKHLIGDEDHESYVGYLTPTPGCTVQYTSVNNKHNKMFEMICDNPGCDKPGSKKCARCGMVSYCGRDCQQKHWKTHKKVCGKADGKASSRKAKAPTEDLVKEEMGRMRLTPSSDEVARFEKRCADEDFDFIFTGDPHMDWGVQFTNPIMQLVWPRWMEAVKDDKTPGRDKMLTNMLGMLHDASKNLRVGTQQCKLTKREIRAQLESLYGSFDEHSSAQEKREDAASIWQAQADLFQSLGSDRSAELVANGILPPLEQAAPRDID